jgi:hypothetical protein
MIFQHFYKIKNNLQKKNRTKFSNLWQLAFQRELEPRGDVRLDRRRRAYQAAALQLRARHFGADHLQLLDGVAER